MEKLNIAEILKDCPRGMELNCMVYDDIYFDYIDENYDLINCYIKYNDKRTTIVFNAFGCFHPLDKAKCVIFPKGKTTWKGFQRPFKDGDVIFTHANCLKVGVGNTWISIYKENRNGGVATYVDYAEDGDGYYSDLDGDKAFLCMEEDILRQRFATEEEKQKLFDAIKTNGYKWNPETKTLEKLIEPKFKVGDKIVERNSVSNSWIVSSVNSEYYTLKLPLGGESIAVLSVSKQDNYELLLNTNKFDISTLKPFKSKVLVRDYNFHIWEPAFWGKLLDEKNPNLRYLTTNGCFKYCIPYENNQHLLGTTNDCDEYFKTWE